MALCRSLAMRAEKRARLGRMRGLTLRQTSMTYRHRPRRADSHAGHQLRLQAAPTSCRVLRIICETVGSKPWPEPIGMWVQSSNRGLLSVQCSLV